MTDAGESAIRGLKEALAISKGKITAPHETIISQHGERLVIRTIDHGVETRCEIRRAPQPKWKAFYTDDTGGKKILIDSRAAWSALSETYKNHIKSSSASWLRLARVCPLSLHEDIPYFGFYDIHCGSLMLETWAEQNDMNLKF